MIIKDVELKTWGNSKALRIGKDEMAALGLSDKQLGLRMVVDNGKIVLTPKKNHHEIIDELFADYDGTALNADD
ncbi:toxin-antitoxin system, antitoxin component, AbrB family protein [Enterococcus hulanensis]|uniref:AbrB/MazE/SpoVT family DNA-binding domain-containing protein n=1 Tax=Enterococcus hulanensis TaxID=2559929 RepID=UPI002890821A|nr:toxin-antitoxin system, antitoxin component, AbrB family protein [Enterococcus hulanensis]MDT2661254.1 toxin-antitoxin system, antitoxin component, AbrB family protein [Enterococcus hulanensis]